MSGVMIREALRVGTVAGLAMIPFAAAFRSSGLRVNEYGRKTLGLMAGDLAPRSYYLLTFVQHMIISWLVALPLLVLLGRLPDRRSRALAGTVYGAAFYLVVNSLALPLAFGDNTPWSLGLATVYPSLVVHLVYGLVVGLMVRPQQ